MLAKQRSFEADAEGGMITRNREGANASDVLPFRSIHSDTPIQATNEITYHFYY